MELKQYQSNVLDDLKSFLALLNETSDIPKAYERHWNERDIPVGFGGIAPYKNIIKGVPNICIKVPTGGGKTFIAANTIKPIFDSLPATKTNAVVWLVPSDAILEQTFKALSNSSHPYRQKLDTAFSHRVEVYSKQQLLGGQNFNPSTIVGQLSIFVLSYDSFRTKSKDGRKAYQENGNLSLFAKFFDDNDVLLADTDETALIQVIRHLNPVTIVDESHHATSPLSKEMLTNFNPSFILDLTATPKVDSNIISFVDALQLKAENMVKLPVIVYNRKSHTDVFTDAITIRDKLEFQAQKERSETGRYIRPIVLFQAQPKTNNDSTTFEKLKQSLVDIGIPEDQIAIKTADKDDISGIDLLSEDCTIRYIITVNALKEGWDCPFAYVLATIANRTSSVDVEQILGRILRLPYTKKNSNNVLNISYVITSSNDFHDTLERIVIGLNNAGFSDKDYRLGHIVEDNQPEEDVYIFEQIGIQQIHENAEAIYIDTMKVRDSLVLTDNIPPTDDITGNDELFDIAISQAEAYEKQVNESLNTGGGIVPMELQSKINAFYMIPEFADDAKALRIPQFVVESAPTIFSDMETTLLTKDRLMEEFSLANKDTEIDFSVFDAEIARIDIDGTKDAVPKAWKLIGSDSKFFKEWFDSQPPEKKIHHSKDIIIGTLSKLNSVSDMDLREYVGRIVDNLSVQQLENLQQSPHFYSAKIRNKIEALMIEHMQNIFLLWVEQGKIKCEPNYSFPDTISPIKTVSTLPRSLYSSEEEMNGLEQDIVWELANLPNIKWWHRNISRTGFAINGYINAYPDIIARTVSGKILMIEPKGDHLENTESKNKVEIGRIWQNKSGENYRYYMIFKDKDLDGAVRFDKFMEIVKEL